MIINAENLVLGRMATFAAKSALLGETVDVVNCEKAIIIGDPQRVLEKYQQAIKRGIPLKGPYFPRTSDRFVRRVIRGMLPHKQDKGKIAFKRVKCYRGMPKQFEGKAKTIEGARTKMTKSINVGKLCGLLGGKR
ncbi:MAG: 50S ribosomal protein L13 [Nanoarchaeota archaeon]|nr:50S ribosomal protein L13 [Nanoarchaeota archaeon]